MVFFVEYQSGSVLRPAGFSGFVKAVFRPKLQQQRHQAQDGVAAEKQIRRGRNGRQNDPGVILHVGLLQGGCQIGYGRKKAPHSAALHGVWSG